VCVCPIKWNLDKGYAEYPHMYYVGHATAALPTNSKRARGLCSVSCFCFVVRYLNSKKITATKTNLQGDDFTCKHATVYKSRKPTPYRLADAQRGR